jgi:hypothetical protein
MSIVVPSADSHLQNSNDDDVVVVSISSSTATDLENEDEEEEEQEEAAVAECPICMDSRVVVVVEVQAGEWVTLKCGHSFHTVCIDGWIAAKNTCPICRREVLFLP